MSALVEKRRDGEAIARVVMRDAGGRNALSETLVCELTEALAAVAADGEVKVVVLEGLNDVFCAGAPRELLLQLAAGTRAPAEIVLAKRLLDLPIPVIAAMEGHAVGVGLALGLCADIVLMARDSRYGCNFMDLGFTPGMGITRLLEHVLSPAIAHELLYTGELRRGAEFAGHSGINRVLPRHDVVPTALDLARRIAEKPRLALSVLKRTLSMPRRQAFEASFTLESLMHEITFAGPDVRQRIRENHAA